MAAFSFKTDRAALLAALATTLKVVENKSTIPIWLHLHLSIEPDGLLITGYDGDIQIKVRVPGDAVGSGHLTVEAKTFHDVVRKFAAGGQVSIEHDTAKGSSVIKAGRSRFVLPSLDASAYPSFTAESAPLTMTAAGSTLAEAIGAGLFAVSTEETRYYLCGLYLHVVTQETGEPVLRLVATDGSRLARVDTAAVEGLDLATQGVIVPSKAATMIKALAEGAGQEAVRFGVSANTIAVATETVTLVSKLIDGTFPDYQRAIPIGNNKLVLAPKTALAAAVDRVATLAEGSGRPVKMHLALDGVTVSAHGQDGSEANDGIDVRYDGPELSIGFNSRFLAGIINAAGGDEVEIALEDPMSPTLFRNPNDGSRLYVLMPMRV